MVFKTWRLYCTCAILCVLVFEPIAAQKRKERSTTTRRPTTTTTPTTETTAISETEPMTLETTPTTEGYDDFDHREGDSRSDDNNSEHEDTEGRSKDFINQIIKERRRNPPVLGLRFNKEELPRNRRREAGRRNQLVRNRPREARLEKEDDMTEMINKLVRGMDEMTQKLNAMQVKLDVLDQNKVVDDVADNLIYNLGVQMCIQPNRTEYPKDCADIWRYNMSARTGIYKIKPRLADEPFHVVCDMETEGGGWTVFQRRMDGSIDFHRGWDAYKSGFGRMTGEYWLGLDKLSAITQSKRSELRIDMGDTEGNFRYASYDYFAVAAADALYRMSLGAYYGTAGDSLTRHRNMPFSTKDSDHDKFAGNCAVTCLGAWWYENCHDSNLNGKYHLGPHKSFADGVNWRSWHDYYYSLRKTEMKVRPVGFMDMN